MILVSARGKQDISRSQQQQQMLLSKQQQAELARQAQQKELLEKQKQKLAEQEKALLQLQFEKKQGELDNEKKIQAARVQRAELEKKFLEEIKDKQIFSQNALLSYTRKWVFYLVTLSVITLIVAVIAYLNQRKTKRLNKLISTQHRELEQVSMVKDRLLSVVGHDLRSPVNMLISFTQLLKMGDIEPDRMKLYMDQLESTLDHTSSLMENLLEWAASQMQGYKPVINHENIQPIAAEVVQFLAARAHEKNIALQNNIDVSCMAYCDKDMLSLIIRNLLSNSIKFTSTGGKVAISAEEKKRYTIIRIKDNGTGMKLAKIEQFNTGALATSESTPGTAKEKGTGLGLLLCKTFVQVMHGDISVTNNTDTAGCTFEIVLPNENVVED